MLVRPAPEHRLVAAHQRQVRDHQGLLPRSGEGCKIRFERSHAAREQFYVIIELAAEAVRGPNQLMVCDSDDVCHQFPLPHARRGIIQFLMDGDSELSKLMQDSQTDVFLR